jgi:hypothetical protein
MIQNKRMGRHPDFKCVICGRFVSYDRRKTVIEYGIDSIFDKYQEQWFPEEMVYMYHKKCKTKEKHENVHQNQAEYT